MIDDSDLIKCYGFAHKSGFIKGYKCFYSKLRSAVKAHRSSRLDLSTKCPFICLLTSWSDSLQDTSVPMSGKCTSKCTSGELVWETTCRSELHLGAVILWCHFLSTYRYWLFLCVTGLVCRTPCSLYLTISSHEGKLEKIHFNPPNKL